MLTFTAINEDGKYISYEYKTIEELRKEYWSDSIDMNAPSNDSAITECDFRGTPLYFNTFADLISVFGIDNSGKA